MFVAKCKCKKMHIIDITKSLHRNFSFTCVKRHTEIHSLVALQTKDTCSSYQ